MSVVACTVCMGLTDTSGWCVICCGQPTKDSPEAVATEATRYGRGAFDE